VIDAPVSRLGEAGSPVPREQTGDRISWNVRLLGFSLLLAALPFLTAPGQIIADSKFELATGPSRFLSSALTLWNPQQFGQLPNQVVGYLFPMGPLFELGKLAFTSGWLSCCSSPRSAARRASTWCWPAIPARPRRRW
jgi:arabinofuranan 3-O-arabinosyltransferase